MFNWDLSSFRVHFGWSEVWLQPGLESGGSYRCQRSGDTNEILGDVLMAGTRSQNLLGAGEDQRKRSCIDDRLPLSEQHMRLASHDVFRGQERLRH